MKKKNVILGFSCVALSLTSAFVSFFEGAFVPLSELLKQLFTV